MTSIEWLINEFQIRFPNEVSAMYNNNQLSYEDMFTKAKEMHKQEIIDAFGVGCHHESKRLVGYQDVAEQYYNETFLK